MRHSITTLSLLAAFAAVPASATTFKWASASDIPTWDIHSQNNALGNGVHAAVYESLFYYNSKTFALEPLLATGFKQVSPTQVRITLRTGVKFHDGAAFDADDVVFSLNRAMAKTSNYGVYTQGIDKIVKVDAATVDIFTKDPNPVLLRQLTELRMMDKDWSEKNKSVEPKDIKTKDENFAHRNANGTGPFMLKSWDQDVKLVLAKNPAWWGKMDGNVTEIVYTPIKSEATRVAALLSGEVDMVLDPSPADLAKLRSASNLKVLDGAENRTIFFGMDQFRDELPGSNVKGKNPLKDARVRKALYQAIDIATIARTTMRGLAQPTGTLIAPQVNGWTKKADARWPYDNRGSQEAARRRRLSERLRGRLRLPEQPLYQRRGNLPGGHRDVGAHRRQGQAAHAAAGHLLPDDPALRGEHLHARLGRADLRRAVLAAVAGALGRRRRRRQLQRRPLQQPADGRAGRAHQEGSRSEEPQ